MPGNGHRRGQRASSPDAQGYRIDGGAKHKKGQAAPIRGSDARGASVQGKDIRVVTFLPAGSVGLQAWVCKKCGTKDNWAERPTCRICSGSAPPHHLTAQQAVERQRNKAKGNGNGSGNGGGKRVADMEKQIADLQKQLAKPVAEPGRARGAGATGDDDENDDADMGDEGAQQQGRRERPKPERPITVSDKEKAARTRVE